jgi:hypothetical protein
LHPTFTPSPAPGAGQLDHLFGPVAHALALLPIDALNGVNTPNVAYGLAFGLTEAVLLGIAMGCEDRDESQDDGISSGAISRPHGTS